MKYYTVSQVAEMLDVSDETVHRWIRTDKLKAERSLGRQGTKVDEECLKAFVNKNRGVLTEKVAELIGEKGAGPTTPEERNLYNSIALIKQATASESGKQAVVAKLSDTQISLQTWRTRLLTQYSKLKYELELTELHLKRVENLLAEIDKIEPKTDNLPSNDDILDLIISTNCHKDDVVNFVIGGAKKRIPTRKHMSILKKHINEDEINGKKAEKLTVKPGDVSDETKQDLIFKIKNGYFTSENLDELWYLVYRQKQLLIIKKNSKINKKSK